MPRTFVYSFEDTTVEINHPGFESFSAYGTGLGTVTVSMSNDDTIHDVASDRSVVVSKAIRRNGTVGFTVTQASEFNDWMRRFCNFLEASDTDQYALASIVITNRSTGDTVYCSGVSPQKLADNDFQSQAQQRTWNLMCADIAYQ